MDFRNLLGCDTIWFLNWLTTETKGKSDKMEPTV